MTKDRPLLSFILICYNQEAFIRQAVEAALLQTYSPLEIIISDDCSKDRTFDIAREMVAAYTGPHSVLLSRNESNLGIGGNVNRAMGLCRGELVLLADGDDISLPGRTEMTYHVWEQFDRQAVSISFSYTTITGDGAEQGVGGLRGDSRDPRPVKALEGDLSQFLSTRDPVLCGCSQAWSPVLFNYFGPLKSDLEDLIMSFRALAIGRLLHVQQPVVKYRRHAGNVSFFGGDGAISFEHRESRLRWVDEQTVRAYDNMLADIETLHCKGRITSAERDRLTKVAQCIRTDYATERQMMEGGIFRKLRTLTNAARRGSLNRTVRLTLRLLPQLVYRNLYQLRNKLRPQVRNGRPLSVSTKV